MVLENNPYVNNFINLISQYNKELSKYNYLPQFFLYIYLQTLPIHF